MPLAERIRFRSRHISDAVNVDWFVFFFSLAGLAGVSFNSSFFCSDTGITMLFMIPPFFSLSLINRLSRLQACYCRPVRKPGQAYVDWVGYILRRSGTKLSCLRRKDTICCHHNQAMNEKKLLSGNGKIQTVVVKLMLSGSGTKAGPKPIRH